MSITRTIQGSYCVCTLPMGDDVTLSSLIGWAHSQNDPWLLCWSWYCNSFWNEINLPAHNFQVNTSEQNSMLGYICGNPSNVHQATNRKGIKTMCIQYGSPCLLFKLKRCIWDLKTELKKVVIIMESHQQNTLVFADGRKNMNDVFNDYACSVSHMCPQEYFERSISLRWLLMP